MSKRQSKPKEPTRHVRLSHEVIRALEEKAEGFETPDSVLRRLLQLPPRKKAA